MHLYRLLILKKGWKVCDLETHEIIVSRDVVFHKQIFPYQVEDRVKLGESKKSSSLEDLCCDF